MRFDLGAVLVSVSLGAILAAACESPMPERATPGDVDPELVEPDLIDVRAIAPSVHVEARYAGSHNFVGEPIDGYEAPLCLLSRPAAEALAGVQEAALAEGYTLLAYDCYRPQRAVDHFVRWARDTADQRMRAEFYPEVPKSRLFEDGYIAERSGHSRASTIDLTLARAPDASDEEPVPLDMGTPYDYFDPASATDSPDVDESARASRHRLRRLMEAGGFRNYPAEWWHYTLEDEPYPDSYFDVPVKR